MNMKTMLLQGEGKGYQAIVDAMIRQIVSGQLALGARLPPVRAAAKQYGVHHNTFSRVVRELQQAGYVSTRGRDGTYVSDAWTRTSSAMRQDDPESHVRPLRVGMVATWEPESAGGTWPLHLVLERLLTATVLKGGGSFRRFLWTDPSAAERLVGEIVGTPLDGLVLPSGPIQCVPDLTRRLQDAGVFCVGFSGTQEFPYDLDYVRMGDEWAFREVTRRLIALGHRRIAFVGHSLTEPNLSTWNRVRLAAWRGAMGEAGLACGDEDAFLAQTPDDELRAAGKRLGLSIPDLHLALQEPYGCAAALRYDPHRHTAAVCANDEAAVGFIKGVRARGMRVPEDVSVTGYDNYPDDFVRNELTTFALPEQQISEAFLRMIADHVFGDKPADARTIETLRPILVPRSSWAPIREGDANVAGGNEGVHQSAEARGHKPRSLRVLAPAAGGKRGVAR